MRRPCCHCHRSYRRARQSTCRACHRKMMAEYRRQRPRAPHINFQEFIEALQRLEAA